MDARRTAVEAAQLALIEGDCRRALRELEPILGLAPPRSDADFSKLAANHEQEA